MTDILFAILPVFIILGIGIITDKAHFFPPSTSDILNIYVLRFALPILLLYVMANANAEELFNGKLCLDFWRHN